jgi:hypothetical protein
MSGQALEFCQYAVRDQLRSTAVHLLDSLHVARLSSPVVATYATEEHVQECGQCQGG